MKRANNVYYFIMGVALIGCGSGQVDVNTANAKANKHSRLLVNDSSNKDGSKDNRCDASQKGREVTEYSTSGSKRADVRKVFVRVGDETMYRLVMICREADLNGDGIKDVVRQYDDEGRPLREEADRDFDGKMDVVSYYQRGALIRREIDTDGDGIIDYKVFYEDNKPLRAERDLLKKSTLTIWKPNRWEYYEDGRLIRMGTDTDGDGRVDRWDRNEEISHAAEGADQGQEEDAVTPSKESAKDAATPPKESAKDAAKPSKESAKKAVTPSKESAKKSGN
jgi:hypothetical protein